MKEKILKYGAAVIVLVLFVLSVTSRVFYTVDHFLCDTLYQSFEGPSPEIKLIVIDEDTLYAYGNANVFLREKSAQLIDYLNSEPENKPRVIGMDFVFASETDEATDALLTDACEKAGNVVMANSIRYKSVKREDENHNLYIDTKHIEFVESPFDALKAVTEEGFANANISTDGVIRSATVYTEFEGTHLPSFDESVLKTIGEPVSLDQSVVGIYFSGLPGEYTHYSLKNVLEGNVPKQEFRDAIVLVGAYASGMQDSYTSAASRSREMAGVEIHANIIQALMHGRTYDLCNELLYAAIAGVILLGLFILINRQKLLPSIITLFVAEGISLLAGRILSVNGWQISQFSFLIVILLMIAYVIVDKYIAEKIRRKRVLSTFKKYVAPQVVDEISKDKTYELKLGGEKKDIAVLFVDIRGFTPLSESLPPEKVVAILNEYLALTTKSIFDNNGTLDKFIGDATMAVFNAPFALDDYEMWAIKTALAIRAGGDALSKRLEEEHGKVVRFGIGVNCGEAVVGNIGCDFRMDYTAIGDTVNTSARLESKAGPGEILISPMLYERVKDRILAEEVGKMALKGKAEEMQVYRVLGLKE